MVLKFKRMPEEVSFNLTGSTANITSSRELRRLAVSSHGPHSGAVRWGVWVLAKGQFVPRILTVSNIYCNMSPKYVADAIM